MAQGVKNADGSITWPDGSVSGGPSSLNPFERFARWTKEQFGAATPAQKRAAEKRIAEADARANRPPPGLPSAELVARNQKLADILEGRIAGTSSSPAELQLLKGLDANVAAANSLAASGAGASNPGLAMRSAMFSADRAGSAYNADAAILRAQEQAAAEGRLAALLGQNQQVALGQGQLNDRSSEYAGGMESAAAAQDVAATRARTGAAIDVVSKIGAYALPTPGGGGGQTVSSSSALTQAPAAAPVSVPWAQYYKPPADPYSWEGGGYGGVSRSPLSVRPPHFADGGFVSGPTKAVIGEQGTEAVVPITSEADAKLAAALIGKARAKKRIEEIGAALAARLAGPLSMGR